MHKQAVGLFRYECHTPSAGSPLTPPHSHNGGHLQGKCGVEARGEVKAHDRQGRAPGIIFFLPNPIFQATLLTSISVLVSGDDLKIRESFSRIRKVIKIHWIRRVFKIQCFSEIGWMSSVKIRCQSKNTVQYNLFLYAILHTKYHKTL